MPLNNSSSYDSFDAVDKKKNYQFPQDKQNNNIKYKYI